MMTSVSAYAAPRTTVVALLGDEVLAPGMSKADAEVLFPESVPHRVGLSLDVRCAGKCGERPRMLSVRIVAADGKEIEVTRVQPPKAGGKALVDLSAHAKLFRGARTVRVLVDSLQPMEKTGWRVSASLTLEAPPKPAKPKFQKASRVATAK